MIGAFDIEKGLIAIGKNIRRITAERLDPRTVKILEDRLGRKIGQHTELCPNIVGACAEVDAFDQLIRQGAKPNKIGFTQALRPRLVWRKDTIPEQAIVKTCDNCKITWPELEY